MKPKKAHEQQQSVDELLAAAKAETALLSEEELLIRKVEVLQLWMDRANKRLIEIGLNKNK